MELKRALVRADLEALRERASALGPHPVVASATATLDAILARGGDPVRVAGHEVVEIVVLEVRTGFRCRRVDAGD